MRGQTTLDFAVGVVVFVLTVAFVVAFIPGMFEPFAGGEQGNTVASDRVATQLSTSALAPPERPYVLDQTCITAFFDGTSPSHCGYTGSTLHERIGLDDQQPVHIRIVGDDTLDADTDDGTLCENGKGELVEQTSAASYPWSCSTVYQVGDTPPAGGSETVTLARRAASIDGHDSKLDGTVTLEVRVWG